MGVSSDDRYAALVSKSDMHEKEGLGCSVSIGLISILEQTSRMVEKLVKAEGDAFEFEMVSEGAANVVYKKAGVILGKCIKIHFPDMSQYKASYAFEPYIDMALKYFNEYKVYMVLPLLNLTSDAAIVINAVAHLNECVDRIRREVRSGIFRSKLNSYQRSSNKNYKELIGYVDALFDRYSRLLILRVDLSYKKQYSKTTQTEARRDRERLFGNTRSNKLFGDMVGYIWKLEHGPVKGFHYHVMFFFDGSKVREDGTLAERIGRYWNEMVTKGRGLFYNCNASKWRYKNCGIGMVSHSDSVLREVGLRSAICYLTKTDLYMKLQTDGRGMGKGNEPLPRGPCGRPRSVTGSFM